MAARRIGHRRPTHISTWLLEAAQSLRRGAVPGFIHNMRFQRGLGGKKLEFFGEASQLLLERNANIWRRCDMASVTPA